MLHRSGDGDLHQIGGGGGQPFAAAQVGGGGQFTRHWGIPGTGPASAPLVVATRVGVAGRCTRRHQMPVVDLCSVAVLAADPGRCDHTIGQAQPGSDQVVVDFGVGSDIPHGAIHR